jgi:hypothetical protein
MMKYFDKQTNDLETAYMYKHIKTCSKCREEFENLSEILSCIESRTDVEPPVDFEAQVLSRIKQLKEQTAVKGEKLLIFLYGLTTVILLIVAAGMVSTLKEISFINILKDVNNVKAISDNGILSPDYIYNTSIKFYEFAKGSLKFLYELTTMVMRSYSYIFVLSLAVLMMLQKLFFNLLGQASGRGFE